MPDRGGGVAGRLVGVCGARSDQGKEFSTPEVVPFRLTQNMVDVFGPSGYEGTLAATATRATAA